MKEFDINKAVKVTEYNIRGEHFSIEIKHWYTEGYEKLGINGEHHWCMYAVICNDHPLFKKATQNLDDYDTELGNEMYPNFHGGCTYYDKQLTYVKIGCDYHHIGDKYYWECEELPSEIEQDAKELFDWFEARERKEEQ